MHTGKKTRKQLREEMAVNVAQLKALMKKRDDERLALPWAPITGAGGSIETIQALLGGAATAAYDPGMADTSLLSPVVVAAKFYNQGLFAKSCADFKKWLRVASSSEAGFGRAVNGFAGIISRTLNRRLRHEAHRQNKAGIPDEHHSDLTMDSGGLGCEVPFAHPS